MTMEHTSYRWSTGGDEAAPPPAHTLLLITSFLFLLVWLDWDVGRPCIITVSWRTLVFVKKVVSCNSSLKPTYLRWLLNLQIFSVILHHSRGWYAMGRALISDLNIYLKVFKVFNIYVNVIIDNITFEVQTMATSMRILVHVKYSYLLV